MTVLCLQTYISLCLLPCSMLSSKLCFILFNCWSCHIGAFLQFLQSSQAELFFNSSSLKLQKIAGIKNNCIAKYLETGGETGGQLSQQEKEAWFYAKIANMTEVEITALMSELEGMSEADLTSYILTDMQGGAEAPTDWFACPHWVCRLRWSRVGLSPIWACCLVTLWYLS